MKNIVLILAVLLVSCNCNSKNGATINFQTKVHDFGEIFEKDKIASYEFKFTNTGKSALVINNAIASCGCTTPVYPKEPIAAGASGTIKVTYNTVGRPGAFHKTITVYCNDTAAPNVILIIKGTVISNNDNPETTFPKNMQGLRLKRGQVSMLDAKIGSVASETIEIINTNKDPLKILFYKLPKHIQVTASKPVLKANETGQLIIKYTPSLANDYGKREDYFYIVTNPKDKENPNNKFRVSAYITEDFSHLNAEQRQNAPKAIFSENRVNFGTMAPGTWKSAAISLTNNGNSPLFIRKIVPEYDGIKVIPEKTNIQAGKSIKVKINFYAGSFHGNVIQRISVFTNDPQNSLNRILLTASVTDKE